MTESAAAQHRRVTAALLTAARADPEHTNPYVRNSLSAHVAAAGAWADLAAAEDVIDLLNPDALVADLLRDAYGRILLPPALASVLPARAQLAAAAPADRPTVRAIAAARLARQYTPVRTATAARWRFAWAQRPRDPLHVVLDVLEPVAPHPWGRADETRRGLVVTTGPGGRPLLVVFSGVQLRFWDPLTGTPAGDPVTFREPITALAAVPSTNVVAVATATDLWRWDPVAGSPLGEPAAHPETITALAAGRLPDGRPVIVSAAADVRLWHAESGQPASGTPLHDGPVTAMTFDPPILTVAYGDQIRMIEAGTGRRRRAVHAGGDVIALAAHRTLAGLRLILAVVAVGGHHTVRVWDAATRKRWDESLTDPANLELVADVGAAGESAVVAVADRFGAVRLLDPVAMTTVGPILSGHEGSVQAITTLTVTGGRRMLVTVGADRTVRLWSLPEVFADGEPHRPIERIPVSRIRLLRGDLLAQLHGVREIFGGKFVRSLSPRPGVSELRHIAALAVVESAGGTLLAAGTKQGFIHLYDAGTGAPAGPPLHVNEHSVWHLAAIPAPGGDLLATYGGVDDEDGWNTEGRLWDPCARERAEPGPYSGIVGRGGVAGSRDFVVAGASHSGMRCWALGSMTAVEIPNERQVFAAAVSPTAGGNALVATAEEERVRLWDAGSGASAGDLEHDGRVRAVAAVRADGPTLIVSYAGDRLRIWDAGTGALRHAFDPGIAVRAMTSHGGLLFLGGDFGVVALDLIRWT